MALTQRSTYLAWCWVLLLGAVTAGCGSGRDPILGTGTGVAQASAPTVMGVTPGDQAAGVSIDTAVVSASFSEAMAPLAADVSFALTCAAPCTNPTGAVALAASRVTVGFTLTAGARLRPLTLYTATVSGARSAGTGIAMTSPYVWHFTTGAAPDVTAPTVGATNPTANATAVASNTSVAASFSEPMDPSTITATNFTLSCPAGAPITGVVAYGVIGNVATLTPAASLPASTTCVARVTTGVRDTASNAIASAYSWSFTTGIGPDVTAPAVSATSPGATATGIAINTLITASFTEPMNPLTVTATTFTLACPAGGSFVAATVAYAANGNVATLTPASPLPSGTICTARINAGVADVAGNATTNPFTWTFTTGVAPDTTAPTVLSTSPSANVSAVATNTLVTVTFSEPMDPQSIDDTHFTLACPSGTPILATVAYAVNGNVATLTPASVLPASTVCSARITTGVTDVAHNPMAAALSWIFTTGVAPDATAPTVTSTNPATGAVGVCINKTVSATFSESMDPLSITTATFTLAIAGAPVTGVVAYDAQGHIATFNAATALIGSPATLYTVTIKGGANGVKDLAGNALAADQLATFTTNASTCTTVPALEAAAPFGGFGGNSTLTNDGLGTVINGDIGVNAASTTITGLHDSGGNVYTITPNNNGLVNGLVYTLTAPPNSVAGDAVTHARADALAAFNAISPANLPGGINMANALQCPSCGGAGGGADELAGRTLPPGVYLSATGSFDLGGAGHTVGSLTLDGGGDTSAVWIFQTAPGSGALNVGLTGPSTPAVPIQVLLINGAQPRNIFWYLPGGAVIGTGSTVAGTLLANAAITMSTTGGTPPSAVTTTINGRAIALTAGVTMTNTVINVPAP